jgi:hypothetical protein
MKRPLVNRETCKVESSIFTYYCSLIISSQLPNYVFSRRLAA